jgi:hypothetical protein
VQEHGDLPHRNSSDAFEKQLAKWINNVRLQVAARTLAPDQVRALEQVPGWAWQTYEHAFEDHFAAITAKIREHGKFPCEGAIDPLEPRLAKWLSHQRNSYAHGDMPEHRIAMLNTIPR